MLSLHQYTFKKESKLALQDELPESTCLPTLLQQQQQKQVKNIMTGKKLLRLRFAKRLSPFLLTSFFLPVAFGYLFITESTNGRLLLCFSFICLEINILYIDFALWNYYERKKILVIWLIETSLVFLAIYFTL
ncbi:MAG TPA: hypothetical protein VN958_11915 [Chitinophagaceae bacterium]|nr:hypothetical protein [Chitinophagaceae bacterium]